MESFPSQAKPKKRTQNRPDPINKYLLIAFLFFALLTLVLAFGSCGKDSTGTATITPAVSLAAPTPTVIEEVELDKERQLQLGGNRPGKVPLNLDETVYFLLTGSDLREWEGQIGAGLTDTIMVAALDLKSGDASLISLPRDTWVQPPGYESYKINQVFSVGEYTDYPGGGPALLMETAGDLLGVQIDYYVQIDFQAFVVLVDSVQGVLVDVPHKILVDPDPSIEGDMKRLEKGIQVLPGDLALGYVRTRSTEEGDFGRQKRQQQVLVGLQKKIASYDILPVLIPKLPGLYRDLSTHIETNLTLNQIIQLAWAARDIDPQMVETSVLEPPLVEAGFNDKGQYVLYPDIESIQKIWSDIQVIISTPVPKPTTIPGITESLELESARVRVLNATTSPGLADATAQFLADQGFSVVSVGNASKFKEETQIFDYTGKPRTVEAILEVMGFTKSKLYYRADPEPEADIEIVLGADWVRENTLPVNSGD